MAPGRGVIEARAAPAAGNVGDPARGPRRMRGRASVPSPALPRARPPPAHHRGGRGSARPPPGGKRHPWHPRGRPRARFVLLAFVGDWGSAGARSHATPQSRRRGGSEQGERRSGRFGGCAVGRAEIACPLTSDLRRLRKRTLSDTLAVCPGARAPSAIASLNVRRAP
eukprot:scaffold1220_cov376-Prasinococcus_capsulatus_cf.AAC.13